MPCSPTSFPDRKRRKPYFYDSRLSLLIFAKSLFNFGLGESKLVFSFSDCFSQAKPPFSIIVATPSQLFHHLNINQFLENNLFCNRSVLIGSSYPCHLIFLLIRQWIFFFQLFQNNFFPFSGSLIHFQQMLANRILQKYHLIR